MRNEGGARQTATVATGASGEILNESFKLLASDRATYDGFGQSVAVSGHVAVVGAVFDDDNGMGSGSAYIFRWDGSAWTEEQKLLASDGAGGDRFGARVALSGDIAVVGAFWHDDNGADSGAAYVFHWNGSLWVEEQKLLAPDGAAGDWFGGSVSVSGDVVVVGASRNDNNGGLAGSAYVFRRKGSSWVLEQKLFDSGGRWGQSFGGTVSVSGLVVVVGAGGDGLAGSVFVFRWNGMSWVDDGKLLPSDGDSGDGFGRMAISGDVAIVGALRDDDNGQSSGSAYVFRWDGSQWLQEQKLLASDGAAGDSFGRSVSISGDVAIVGSFGDDDNGVISGSAYLFRWDGLRWVEEHKLLASDGAARDSLGGSVSISGDVAMAGAYQGDADVVDTGSAYVFDIGPPITDCNSNGIDDADDIANCVGDLACGDCNRNEVPDGCEVGPGVAGFNLSFDYLAFSWCMEGPVSVSIDACCVAFDVEVNDSVDLNDFANFQRMFIGD